MPTAPERFSDQGESVEDFLLDPVLVVCPRCQECAASVRREGDQWSDKLFFASRRLACVHCGNTKDTEPLELGALWLQTSCCGEVLWAYNHRHLEMIAEFVSADLRQRTRDPKDGWRNRSLASRLPRWIKLAKNRDAVLEAVGRLKAKLLSTSS